MSSHTVVLADPVHSARGPRHCPSTPSRQGAPGVSRVDRVQYSVCQILLLDLAVDSLGGPGVSVTEHLGDQLHGNTLVDEPLARRFAKVVRSDMGNPGVLTTLLEIPSEAAQWAKS